MKNVRNLTSFFIPPRGQFDNVSFCTTARLGKKLQHHTCLSNFLTLLWWCSLQEIFCREKESLGEVGGDDEKGGIWNLIEFVGILHGD
jgi:hypothetical protein